VAGSFECGNKPFGSIKGRELVWFYNLFSFL